MVHAAQIIERTIGAPARQIAGAVQTALLVKGVVDKLFSGQLRSLPVSAPDSCSPDEQLASHPDGRQVALPVQNARVGVGNGPADPHHPALVALQTVYRGPNGGFGGPVHVPNRTSAAQQFPAQFGGQSLTATENVQTVVTLPSGFDQHGPRRRRGLHHRCAAAPQLLLQQASIYGYRMVHHLDSRSADQRQVQL